MDPWPWSSPRKGTTYQCQIPSVTLGPGERGNVSQKRHTPAEIIRELGRGTGEIPEQETNTTMGY